MKSNSNVMTSDVADTSSTNNTNDDGWSPTKFFPVKRLDQPQTPGEYVQQVDDLAKAARPDLRFLAKELKWLGSVEDTTKGRVALLKFSNSSAPGEKVISRDVGTKELEMDLKKGGEDGWHRLYILEDISYEHVEIFGSQLSLDPSFFARHLRVTRWESSTYASNAPPLPSSTIDGVRSFLLRYPELVVFPPKLEAFPKDVINNRRCYYCNCHLYREITFTRIPVPNFPSDNIGVIRRKLSFWSRTRDNGAWVGEL